MNRLNLMEFEKEENHRAWYYYRRLEEDEFIGRFVLSRLLNTFPDKSQNVDWIKYD